MSSMTLSQLIEVEQGKRKPADVTELTLDHCKSDKVEGLSDDFVNLEFLSLSNVGLTSLDGLPNLPNLKSLELSNNSLNGGLDLLEKCPNLRRLDLSYNKFDSIEALLPLAKLSSLVNLHLSNCAVASTEDYRKLVFAALPTLKSLDGSNEDGESVEDNIPNGAEANGDEEEEEVSDDEEEEEYGIEALQRSGELEDDDDEEDYAPGEDEEAELDEYDDDIDDEEDVDEDDTGANLSGAGVEGPRRPASKRRLEADVGNGKTEDGPVAKQQIVSENNEEAVAD